jgi:DNA topoisomerase-1
VVTDLASQELSAGRVQTPAVWLAVVREREIAGFKPTSHFGAVLRFAGAKLVWTAEWLTKPDFTSDDEPYFMDREFAERVAAVRVVTVELFYAGESRRAPPAPFTTSTLQQAASVKLGMSPAQTMEAAQRLFDQGHITYHRTDNPNVSDEALPDIFAVATWRSARGIDSRTGCHAEVCLRIVR